MHDTARLTGEGFFKVYGQPGPGQTGQSILDVGSMDVNGTLRPFAPQGSTYVGVDISFGPGVDIVLDDPHEFPQRDTNAFDLVVSTSCFEHDEFFWLTFGEMARVVKPGGFIYLSAPVNGPVHNHPIDAWRFYPDAGQSLARWATKCGYLLILLESFLMPPQTDIWTDFVAVFGKPPTPLVGRLSDLFPQSLERRP